jgi:hypothetical protein
MSFHGVKYLSRRRNQIHLACDRDFKDKNFYVGVEEEQFNHSAIS